MEAMHAASQYQLIGLFPGFRMHGPARRRAQAIFDVNRAARVSDGLRHRAHNHSERAGEVSSLASAGVHGKLVHWSELRSFATDISMHWPLPALHTGIT